MGDTTNNVKYPPARCIPSCFVKSRLRDISATVDLGGERFRRTDRRSHTAKHQSSLPNRYRARQSIGGSDSISEKTVVKTLPSSHSNGWRAGRWIPYRQYGRDTSKVGWEVAVRKAKCGQWIQFPQRSSGLMGKRQVFRDPLIWICRIRCCWLLRICHPCKIRVNIQERGSKQSVTGYLVRTE